jgi:hypothetical protein
MALYNENLAGRFNRAVQKLLSMKGPASLPTVNPDLYFTHGFQSGYENRYTEGWDLFGVAATAANPGIGNFSTVVLRNPAGSGVVAVVTRLSGVEATLGGGVGTVTVFRPGSNGAGGGNENNLVTTQGIDARGRPASTLIISNNTGAAVARTGGIAIFALVPTTTFPAPLGDVLRVGEEIPILPGALVTIGAGTGNEAFSWFAWWRERALEDSEKA